MATSRKKKFLKSKGTSAESTQQQLLSQCTPVLRFLNTRPEAAPFLEPVDWEAWNLTDYPEIITHPMDLRTVQERLSAGKHTFESFVSDVRLVWKNAMTYNRPGSDIYITAEKLSKLFERKILKLKKIVGPSSSSTPSATSAAVALKRKRKAVDNKESLRAERVRLTQLIVELSDDQLVTLLSRLHRDAPEALNESMADHVELELKLLEGHALQAATAYAAKCIAHKKRKGVAIPA